MNDLLLRLRDGWLARAERERRVLSVGAAALLLIVAYLAVWEPLQGLHQQRARALADARALAAQLEVLAAESRGATDATVGSRQQSLLSVVDQSGKASTIGKAPSRLQPEGDAIVRIWFEDVPFDAVVRWLGDLRTRHGVTVADAEIERESGSGLVNARLTLARAP